jgi:two-component system chemotaxis response regulator CheY
MIADDEPSVRMFLKMVMRPLGLTVVAEARNGQEAVDLFRKEKPDLLLLDFNMPVKCGDKVLDELVHDFPDVRVIMLTSVAEAATVKRCINLGAINYLRKDMPVEQMRAALRSVFETIKA